MVNGNNMWIGKNGRKSQCHVVNTFDSPRVRREKNRKPKQHHHTIKTPITKRRPFIRLLHRSCPSGQNYWMATAFASA